jgi:alkylation response protein AidB-like acyl-CoA dehydrogenase
MPKRAMDRYLTDQHRELQEEVRAFAREAIGPVARALDEEAKFPWENVKAMAERGWLGITVPKEYGGMGRDYLSYTLAVEELARVDASHSITVSAHTTLGTSPILSSAPRSKRRSGFPSWLAGRFLEASASRSREPGPTLPEPAPGQSGKGKGGS